MTETNVNKASEMSRLEATIWFWSVAGFFAMLWVFIPGILHSGYRGDVIEVLVIAPEWVWATKKHPMLPAWMLEILNILTDRSFAVPYLATQACTVLTLWSVWKLGRTVLDERLALIGAFSVFPYLFFACKPIWFNQNNVLIAFWALSVSLIFLAWQTNQKRYWISAGIALGLAFHAKYPAIFLVLSILVSMLVRKDLRQYFWTPGPCMTTLIAFAIFLPHVIWLFHHDFATFSYMTIRPSLPWWFAPFHFAGGQMLYVLLILAVLFPVFGRMWKVRHHEPGPARECEKFLFYCFMIPLVCHMFYAGIKSSLVHFEYGAPFWSFGGVWLLLRFQPARKPSQHFRQTVALTIVMMISIAAGFVTLFYTGKQHPMHYFPSQALGKECHRLWHSRFPDFDCPYIAGNDHILFGHAAHFMPVRPSVLLPLGTWANDDDLNNKGGMIVWEREGGDREMPEPLRFRFPKAEVLPETPELPYQTRKHIPPLKIGIAVVPPPET